MQRLRNRDRTRTVVRRGAALTTQSSHWGRGKKRNSLQETSAHSSQLESRVSPMRKHLSLQEVELLSNKISTESTQQLRDQYSQVRKELKASIQELRGESRSCSRTEKL